MKSSFQAGAWNEKKAILQKTSKGKAELLKNNSFQAGAWNELFSASNYFCSRTMEHSQKRTSREAQVKPPPKEARQTRASSLINPCSQASLMAMGTEAAVVFP